MYNGMINDRLEDLSRQSDPPFLSVYSGNIRIIRSRELYILGAAVKDGGIMRGLEALLIITEMARRFGFT